MLRLLPVTFIALFQATVLPGALSAALTGKFPATSRLGWSRKVDFYRYFIPEAHERGALETVETFVFEGRELHIATAPIASDSIAVTSANKVHSPRGSSLTKRVTYNACYEGCKHSAIAWYSS